MLEDVDDNICSLHQVVMTNHKLPILYGLPMFDLSWDVQDELFPNALRPMLGGCSIGDDIENEATRNVCDEHGVAETAWRAENDPHIDKSPAGTIDIFSDIFSER